jgi:DNA repair protein RecO (recombination protein O)
MVQITRAIVIHTFPYSDTSLILKGYSEKFGYCSFLLKGFKRNRKQKVILHPLALVEISTSGQHHSTLKLARSIDLQNPFSQLLMDPVKSGMAMFIAEWLGFTINEDKEGDPEFFNWLISAIDSLNHSDSIANFHIWFLLKLGSFLGFAPQGNKTLLKPYFDLREGYFTDQGSSNEILNEQESLLLNKVLNLSLEEIVLIKINKIDRATLLRLIHRYFQLHLEKEFTLKSLDVLAQLYD